MLPLDLHVLGLPLAFILSQDQTLHCKCLIWLTLWNRFSSSSEEVDAISRGGDGLHPTPKSRMTILPKKDGFGLLHQVIERLYRFRAEAQR